MLRCSAVRADLLVVLALLGTWLFVVDAEGLPRGGRIIGAYGNWGQCDEQMVQVVRDGANVLFWFAAHLVSDSDGKPIIATGLNLQCIANVSGTLKSHGLATTHLLSIGGWCGAHPDVKWSGAQWFATFDAWNRRSSGTGAPLFDGFDWDVEGCTEKSWASLEVLSVMGEMSVAAKASGYIVAMAPAQSYLDVETSEFNLALNNPPVASWNADFHYHGRNTYAYLLARFGTDTFDLVSIQLYESWSAAHHAITNQSVPFEEYLERWVDRLSKGWLVNFSSVGVGPKRIAVSPDKLIVGVHVDMPHGLPEKVLKVTPLQLQSAWSRLERRKQGHAPRGVMFWCVACGDSSNLTTSLNSFLLTRASSYRPQASTLLFP